MKSNKIVLIGIFASVISLFSCIAIPVGAVPVSLSLFGVFLSAVLLGEKISVPATLVYILIGCVGLPVFSGFRGGIDVILGPTGGYIAAYPIAALVSGLVSKNTENKKHRLLFSVLGNISALILIYLFGTLHFSFVTENGIRESVAICVLPFLVFDLAKCILAGAAGVKLKSRIKL